MVRHPTRNKDARSIVLNAIQVNPGLTKVDLVILLENDLEGSVKRSIGQTVAALERDNLVTEDRFGKLYLAEIQGETPKAAREPTNGAPRHLQETSGNRVLLSPFQSTRQERKITIYSSPIEIEDAVALELQYEGGARFRVPLGGASTKVCTGPDIPKWSPDQETVRGLVTVRVIRKSGDTVDIQVQPSDNITIDVG